MQTPTIQLPKEEWDFRNVPDEELPVCRIWEYARESETILSIWRRSLSMFGRDWPLEKRFEHVGKDFQRAMTHLGFAAKMFQVGIYAFGGSICFEDFYSPFPHPWQRLSAQQRMVLMATATYRYDLGFTGFHRAQTAAVKALAHFPPKKKFKEVFGDKVSVSEFFHAGQRQRDVCPCIMYPSGAEILGVEINWGKFTDKELVAEFAQWVKENRPEGKGRNNDRGKRKGAGFASQLNWLGMLRLMHAHPFTRMKEQHPAAWRVFKNADWPRARKEAGRVFRELFPFAPAVEKPLHWKTAGGRSS